MKVTKLALDPRRRKLTSNCCQAERQVAMAMIDVRQAMRALILNALTDGDVIRTLKMLGHPAKAIEIVNGNELHAKALELLINQFEEYIEQGFGYNAAIYQLIEDGWVEKIGGFVLHQLEGENNG